MTPALLHRELGAVEYDEAHALQLALRRARLAGEGTDTVFTLEHSPPVLTAGRRVHGQRPLAPAGALEAASVQVREIERGGEWTFHGPGQLVAYPVLALERRRLRVPCFVGGLEDAMAALSLEVLAACGVPEGAVRAGVEPGLPGTWLTVGALPPVKVGAVGVHVQRFVTMHGLALNLDPDPWGFAWIDPCGLGADRTSSLRRVVEQAGGDPAGLPSVREAGARLFELLGEAWERRAAADACGSSS